MSGAAEHVSAYSTNEKGTYLVDDINNKKYAGVLYTNRNTKYVETYEYITSNKAGDAVYETSFWNDYCHIWDYEYSYMTPSAGTFCRGNLSMFSFGDVSGSAGLGFRVALAVL